MRNTVCKSRVKGQTAVDAGCNSLSARQKAMMRGSGRTRRFLPSRVIMLPTPAGVAVAVATFTRAKGLGDPTVLCLQPMNCKDVLEYIEVNSTCDVQGEENMRAE